MDVRGLEKFQRAARFSAIGTAVTAALVLVGWTFDLEILKRIVPGLIAMNPMTAVAFLIVALSLWLFARESNDEQNPLYPWLGRACALLVALIGVAKLVALVYWPDIRIDRWVFSSKLAHGFGMPNVMAPNTAFNFLLIGIALLLLHSRKPSLSPWSCICALISGFQALLAVLGYAYGIKEFYGMASFVPMALHTATTFLLVVCGILSCQANYGFLAIVTGNNAGGMMARRLLPAAILLPAVIGWLRLEGQRLGFFDSDFGVALYTVTVILFFGSLVASNAHLLFKTDAERTKAEIQLRHAHDELEGRVRERTTQLSNANAELQKARDQLEERVRERTASLCNSEERYRLLFESNPYPVWVYDLEALSFLAVNEAAVHHYGYSREEFLSMTIKDIRPTEDLPALLENISKPASSEPEKTAAWRHRRKDGSLIDVEITTRPISFGEKRARLVLVNDITERKRIEDALHESKRQLETVVHEIQLIMDNSRDVICTIDHEGRFLTVSAACKTLWGYKPAELVGRQYIDMVHPEDRLRTNGVAAQIMVGGSEIDFENRYIRKDGALIHVMWSAYWSEANKTMFAVAHDITERALSEKTLKQSKEEADHANQAKSEFLSRMSHELRTPMNAILGFAQLLELEQLSADQREAVGHILHGGRHLLELINEVLDLSRIEAGRLSLSTEPVAVAQVLGETMELVRPLATEREVRLYPPADCGEFILADRQRLKQILINLFSNAIKYNRRGGSVTTRYEKIERLLRISIVDTGKGIPPQRLKQLFIPFERLGAEQSTVEGTGLGLAVAKRLVEAMGGTIGVESNSGEGSTFSIEFQLTESPLDRDELKEEFLPVNRISPPVQRTILYIEDNVSNLKLMERVLSRRPEIKLLSCSEGAAGLSLADEHRPDLILLDLDLPDMSGHDVLVWLQNNPNCSNIPVIVVSADATRNQIAKLTNAGARDYLTKPLDIKKFINVLDRTLEGVSAQS